jgi:site-specific DNA-adenine methylase
MAYHRRAAQSSGGNMRYQGGKSRIASHIAAEIRKLYSTATEIWEPFCGGGAVTLALAKVGFKVHASDSHEDLILMWQALMRGETKPFTDVTEAEYVSLIRASPSARRGAVGFGASFGGGWFAGYARTEGRVFIQESFRNCSRLRDLDIAFTLTDYTSTPDHVLVYADPPYRGTKLYKGTPAFNHAVFWSWVRHRRGPTFVSELSGPDDIDIVWRKQHKSQNASNSPVTKATSKVIKREERLYFSPGYRTHEPKGTP